MTDDLLVLPAASQMTGTGAGSPADDEVGAGRPSDDQRLLVGHSDGCPS